MCTYNWRNNSLYRLAGREPRPAVGCKICNVAEGGRNRIVYLPLQNTCSHPFKIDLLLIMLYRFNFCDNSAQHTHHIAPECAKSRWGWNIFSDISWLKYIISKCSESVMPYHNTPLICKKSFCFYTVFITFDALPVCLGRHSQSFSFYKLS